MLDQNRVVVTGSSGYIGSRLVNELFRTGYDVLCIDNLSKRAIMDIPGIPYLGEFRTLNEPMSVESNNARCAIRDFGAANVIHLGEIASAPYSMMGQYAAVETVTNNVRGTLALIHAVAACARQHGAMPHIIKLGTMGEYGTPGTTIPEGEEAIHFPKRPGSWYHCSKVCDSVLLEYACRAWAFSVTDVNQGPVYGVGFDWNGTQPFYYDSVWGTVINRFLVQKALNLPLTVYGSGTQTRGFIAVDDAVRALMLMLDHKPREGELRIVNQITEILSVKEAAEIVSGNSVNIQNARIEAEYHAYDVTYEWLKEHGLADHDTLAEVVEHEVHRITEYFKKFPEQAQKAMLSLKNEEYVRWQLDAPWRQTYEI